jgi:hypothetical protein
MIKHLNFLKNCTILLEKEEQTQKIKNKKGVKRVT